MLRTRIALLTLTPLAALALSGCTSSSYTCDGQTCNISLSGKKSKTTLGEKGSEVELLKADGKKATVRIGNQSGDLAKGESIDLNNGSITVTEVGKDSVKLKVVQTGESSSDESSDTTSEESSDSSQ